MLFLGEEGFARSFTLRPDEYPDRKTGEMKPWSSNSNWCKDWLAEAAASGRRVLTFEQLRQIRQRSPAHYWSKSYLNPDREPDGDKPHFNLGPVDGGLISDLKTTADAHPSLLEKTLQGFGYHMQLALAGMGLRETLGLDLPDTGGYAFVFIESETPHAISVVEVDGEAIYWARRELRAAIRTFADCLEKGRWPAYGDDVRVVGLPDYHRKRLQFEADAGQLPEDYSREEAA
ncbi:MAG: phage protein [Xanthobacteraceae bacterium]|nr:MAG: phage protein [Xanthobacteraceae bacterium]